MQRQNSYVFNKTNIIFTYKRQLVEVQEEQSLTISWKRKEVINPGSKLSTCQISSYFY